MPPIYDWSCKRCGKKAMTLRGFDGHRDPPNEEEGGECSAGEHEWSKDIGVPLVTKAPGFGKKGHWALLLLFAAASLLGGCNRKPPEPAWQVGDCARSDYYQGLGIERAPIVKFLDVGVKAATTKSWYPEHGRWSEYSERTESLRWYRDYIKVECPPE